MDMGISDYVVLSIGWIFIGYSIYLFLEKIGVVDYIRDKLA